MQTTNLTVADRATNNLREKYLKVIRPKLKEDLGKKNIYEVPEIEKIVINIGFGKLSPDQKGQEQIATNLANITGQKPMFNRAKKAISAFKTRKGQVIGAKVTLRSAKMYYFLEKLISIVLPRLRDFRGVDPKSFDGHGSCTLGFREMNVFPEVEYARGEKIVGLEVVITTSNRNDEEAKKLLKGLGMPFKK